MSPGIWIAMLIITVSGGFGCWIAMTRHHVSGRGWKAALLFVVGAALAIFAYWSDTRLRRETLFEIVAEGSVGAVPGTPAIERTFPFDVLHADVEHTLIVYPEYRTPTSRVGNFHAELRVRIVDPTARVLIEGAHVHEPYASRPYWQDRRYSFVPSSTGRHTLVLVPITANIPAIHARIIDPLGVPDGRRAPGF